MAIIAKTFINIFADKHPASKAALNNWYQIVKEVDWGNFNDVRIRLAVRMRWGMTVMCSTSKEMIIG